MHLFRLSTVIGALALCAAAPVSPGTSDSTDRAEELLSILTARRAETEETERRDEIFVGRLSRLGPDYVPEVLDVLTGRLSLVRADRPDATLATDEQELLLRGVAAWDEEGVVRRLLSQVGHGASLDEKMIAIRLLGAGGSAESLPAILKFVERMKAAEARHPFVTDLMEESLANIFGRDVSAYRVLSEHLEELDPGVLPGIVRATGRRGDWRALDIHGRLFGRNDALDVSILRALGNMSAKSQLEEFGTGSRYGARGTLHPQCGCSTRSGSLLGPPA